MPSLQAMFALACGVVAAVLSLACFFAARRAPSWVFACALLLALAQIGVAVYDMRNNEGLSNVGINVPLGISLAIASAVEVVVLAQFAGVLL